MENPKEFLTSLFYDAVNSADPKNCLSSHLTKILDTPPRSRTMVIGAGKAAGSMAKALEDFWLENYPNHSLEGLVITRYGHRINCKNIEVVEAGHPIPDASSTIAANKLLNLCENLTSNDLAICLISGGCSSLLSIPATGIELEDKQSLTQKLLKSGATIHEMNCIRKHLSKIKGGRLARTIAPAKLITLCISDVPGDELDVIGSGPTVADPTFYSDAIKILEKYKIKPSIKILHHLSEAKEETPKPGDVLFGCNKTALIATPQLALEAAAERAQKSGITPLILGDAIEGEAREVARMHAGITNQVLRHQQPAPSPMVLLSGGETTVNVRGNGRGGRNVEFLLALAMSFRERSSEYLSRISAIACDTDGIDGTEDNAGAIYLPDTLERVKAQKIDLQRALDINDGYSVFKDLGDLFFTGPTLTNVNDFRAILIL